MKPLNLTAEQIADAKARYQRYRHGPHSAASIARELGVSRDGLMRCIDPEFRRRKNARAAKYMARKYRPKNTPPGRPDDRRYTLARSAAPA